VPPEVEMKCPNDSFEMSPVDLQSPIGRRVVVDQCPSCGGIWFDEFEIYQAKDGEAQRIDAVDGSALRNPSTIISSALLCPRDAAQLVQFDDPYFPKGVVIARCPRCHGFWLNRGEFTRYQTARREMKQPREVIIEDTAFQRDVDRAISMQRTSPEDNPVIRAARFLSTPLDPVTMARTDSRPGSETESNVGALVGLLMTVLRLFVFR
jgi:uncharacterized protein